MSLTNWLETPELFKKLNSLSKYPSILTYHEMGKGGRLNSVLSYPDINTEETLYFTEKVDGTNTRIIIKGKDYVIGSREELLHAKGDRIVNPKMDICEHLIPFVERLVEKLQLPDDMIRIFYGETYGGKITKASRQYTSSQKIGFRLFDVIEMNEVEVAHLMKQPAEEIARWRDKGHQPFASERMIEVYATELGFDKVPNLMKKKASELPTDILKTYEFLTSYKTTCVGLDAEGKSEGLIARTADRNYIVKLRFEDYERTLR